MFISIIYLFLPPLIYYEYDLKLYNLKFLLLAISQQLFKWNSKNIIVSNCNNNII